MSMFRTLVAFKAGMDMVSLRTYSCSLITGFLDQNLLETSQSINLAFEVITEFVDMINFSAVFHHTISFHSSSPHWAGGAEAEKGLELCCGITEKMACWYFVH